MPAYPTRSIRRWLVCTCVVAALQAGVAAAAAAELDAKTRKVLEKADKVMQAGDLQRAATLYEKAESGAGTRLYASREGFSRISLLLRDYERSLEHARAALDLAQTPVERAITLNRIGALLFETAHANASAFGDPAGAEILLREERLDDAEAALRESLEISDGRFALAWFNLAEVLYGKEQVDEAKAAVDRHVALTPEDMLSRRAARLQVCLGAMIDLLAESGERGGLSRVSDEGVARPTKISGPNPRYTAAARAQRVQGVVIVESVITEAGDVVCVKPVKGLPHGLTSAATEAVSQWKFEPATLAGEPLAVLYNLTVNFRLTARTSG